MGKFLVVMAAAVGGAWLSGSNMALTPRALQWALAAVILACLASWMGRE